MDAQLWIDDADGPLSSETYPNTVLIGTTSPSWTGGYRMLGLVKQYWKGAQVLTTCEGTS
eukprot:1911318-Amphidinium_carterae.1